MKQLLQLLAGILKTLTRKKSPLFFGDLSRSFPVSPCFGFDRGTPVDRHYIERFLSDNASLIAGAVLEVGDSSYSRRFGSDGVASCTVLQHAALGTDPDALIADLTDAGSLPHNRFDCFICAQTFQYIFDVREAVQGAYHLLKPGGVMLATFPGISQISRYDADRYGDFWRFTPDSVTRLFEPVFAGGISVAACGNALAATMFIQGIPLEELPDAALLNAHDRDYPLIITLVARKGE